MINGNGSTLHSAETAEEGDIAVSPLAVPLLAGPGTIATAMNYSSSSGFVDIIITVSVFAVLCIVTFYCFIYRGKILAIVGESGLSIVTRLMGLILAVIGIQMLIEGLSDVLPMMLNK